MEKCKDCLYHLEIEDEYICVNEISEKYNECTSDNDSCPGFFFYEKSLVAVEDINEKV